jgi:hypothetical protein
LDARYEAEKLAFTAGAEIHVARFMAEADWNLRTDLDHPKSFEHTALGAGIVTEAGAEYALGESWALTANAGYQRWRAFGGRDRTFFKNGAAADTRLNAVNWSSFVFSLGAYTVLNLNQEQRGWSMAETSGYLKTLVLPSEHLSFSFCPVCIRHCRTMVS